MSDTLHAQSQVSLNFDVSSQSLSEAVKRVAERANFNIFLDAQVQRQIANLQSPPLKAEMTLDQALSRLLEGTGLTYRFLNDNTIVVAPPADAGTEPSTDGAREPTPQRMDLEEVVVTGSHLRGAGAPAGSKVLSIDRNAIDRSGYGRVQDVLQALPQNFSGGVNEFSSTDGGAANLNRGHALDLRGLGVSSTLVLVNGRRQANGGLEGSFVDVSSIPTLAVERVEILPEGASAIYGSDAIGGVVNFVLRKDFDGAQTSVRASTADGHGDELQLSQLAGMHWDRGNVLGGYQYYRRDELPRSAGYYSSLGGDMRSLGGKDYRQPRGSPGTIVNSAGVPIFAIPDRQDGRDLQPSDFIPGGVNYTDEVTGSAMLPEQDMHSAFVYASQRIGEHVEVFADARYSLRNMRLPFTASTPIPTVTSANPFYVNPSGGTAPIRVAYDFINDLGNNVQLGDTSSLASTLGTTLRVGAGWKMNLAATYARENNEWSQINQAASAAIATALLDTNPATALNLFGDGGDNNPATLDKLRISSTGEALATVRSVGVIADGGLFDIPGGTTQLALGVDYREERLAAERGTYVPSTEVYTRATSSIGDMDREVSAVFAELGVPLVGESNSRPGLRRLALSLAARYEDYSDFGTTFNPKAGISWSPVETLTVRGSWGTSFRAPRLNELNPNVNPPSSSLSQNVQDPRSPTGRTAVLSLGGNNPDIQEETADVWAVGLDWSANLLGGLDASVTYFSFDYKDKIGTPPGSSTILPMETEWAEVIDREITQAKVDAICNRVDFREPRICLPASAIGAIIDGRVRNVAGVRVRGLDVDLSQTVPSDVGNFVFGINGTYTLEFERAVSGNAPYVSIVDTVGNVPELRLRGDVRWSFAGWSASVLANYLGSSWDPTSSRSVGSWTTFDASLRYQFGEGTAQWWNGVSAGLTAVNLLDKRPPFADRFTGYDNANARDIGRLVSASLTKSW